MADSREPYAAPEMTLYVYQGGTSAIMAFAEDVTINVDDTYRKFLFPVTATDFGARSQYVLTDRNVRMQVGRLYAGVATLFQTMDSAVNISAIAVFNGSADAAVDTFALYSARISNYQAQGHEGQIWRDGVTIIAPDISGF